eukprot:jgi/Mesen1/2369/ME000156S01510
MFAAAEAGRRKQAAQRRGVLTRGAGDHLRASVEGYRAALALPLPPGLRLEALFELGEAFLLLSEAVLGEATAAAGGPLLSNGATRARAADVERRGRLAAADFCSANALAAWADALADLPPADTSGSGSLSGPEPGSGPGSGLGSSPGPVPEGGSGGVSAARLLDEAGLRYARALERAPDDVEVLTNLADCAIRRAEVS